MLNQFTNRLINETSPYLLQHAHNPVDWFAWGDEALSTAKAEDKLILVSIGYSACHWCHVMERESFEVEATAKLMNEHFINIKIDREERPDLDHIYMDAIQAISGSGGWPLNIFLTPDAKPFFGGTYFPPVKAFNRSSWTEVLQGVSQAWKERKSEILSQAQNLTDHLHKSNSFSQAIFKDAGEKIIDIAQCDSMFSTIMQSADSEWGGFGKAPKFPQTFTISYLLQYHYFTGNSEALQQALISIDKMLSGGIYDHLGGGLARYSTDTEWLAPHFEKMLYDNALLINVLCDAYQLTQEKKYEVAIRKTISFVIHELLDEKGGFYAALDADSEGVEGKYYVWQKSEIDKLLGDDSNLFCSFFDVTEQGNWEEKNILRILKSHEDFISDNGLEKDQFLQSLENSSAKLLARRNSRIKPSLDDKIILGWNALMLTAITKAAVVLQDDQYRSIAEKNIVFIEQNFTNKELNGGLFHTYKNGVARYPAFLDDYAYLISALTHLYKLTFNEDYLNAAYKYCSFVIENFSDEDGILFYFTHIGQKDIIVRKKEIYDGATPSGNSVMAENLYQLAIIFDRQEWRNRADKMLEILLPSVVKYPGSFGIWARLLLQQITGLNEIAVIGTDFASVAREILLNFIPNLVIMGAAGASERFALLANRPGQTHSLIYLCRNYTCLNPFSDPGFLMKKIDKTNKITR